eukprot:TRINITY_DN7671_c0_g1_i1.p1 TRINITY_DN7671_c0_g1~~TRINITY_DN7671_c0_g1_i1.p1  ORF type:complete len:532 (+),score=78.98 TRINITY_DN7671_c0_g1_i1:842-2437(+)
MHIEHQTVMASFASSITSPLTSCAPGHAVVASLHSVAKLSHVKSEELLEALHKTQSVYDAVQVTSEGDDVTIDDPSVVGDSKGAKARIIQGKTRAWGETSSLMGHSVLSTSLSTVLTATPSSVRIKAAHAPLDALYLIPNHDDSCGVVIPQLVRTPSIIPTFPPVIKQVKEIGIQDDGFYYLVVEYARPAFIWVILLVAVIGLASKAVVAEHMYPPEVPPVVKSVWMTGVCATSFACLAVVEYYSTPRENRNHLSELLAKKPFDLLATYILGASEPHHRQQQEREIPCFGFLMVVLSSVLHGLFSLSFLVSLSYTSLEQCIVLMNLHPILVLLSRFNRTHQMERVGALLVSVSVFSLIYSSPRTSEGSNPLLGNLLAFMVSVYMWVYLNLSQQLQADVPNNMLMTIINTISFVVQVLYVIGFESTSVFVELGDFSSHTLPNVLGGLIGGTLAYGGFMISGRYLNPLVVSVHITLEPLFAVLINIASGGASPSFMTWESLTVLIVGAVLVAIGGKHEQEDKVVTDHDTLVLT